MTKLKALTIIQCRDYVLARHGTEGLERIQAALPEETRRVVYIEPLVATDWVEVSHGVAHALSYEATFGTGDGRASARMVRDVTADHISGLYRTLLVGSTPRMVLEKSSRVWQRYYDRGESQIEMIEETVAIKRILGCPDMPRYHELLSTPYYETLLRHVGAKDVIVKHTKCVADGAECCETELRWRAEPAGSESPSRSGKPSSFKPSSSPRS